MDTSGTVAVSLISAKGLRAADWGFRGGSSDPFCACEVVGKPDTKVKTAHKSKTLAPVWNEEHVVDEYEHGDTLELSVWDHDKFGDPDLLGRFRLPPSMFVEQGFEGEVNLIETGKSTPTLMVKIAAPVFPPPFLRAPSFWTTGYRLLVKVISAKGLRAADFSLRGKGSSDPFCVVQIPNKPDSEMQTAHVAKTLAPVWEEELEIDEYAAGDSIDFGVFDYDKGSAADLLGKVTLTSEFFDRAEGFDGQLRLRECGEGKNAKLRVKIVFLPPLRPPMPPIAQPGSLIKVTMISASGLRPADFSFVGKGASDPYCTVELLGKEDSQVESKHVEKTLDPVWNEEDIVEEYENGDALFFRVWDYDKGSSADLLGRARLPFNEFDREDGFEGELRLKECGKGFKAKLKVKVQMLPPSRPPMPPVFEQGGRLLVKLMGARGLRAADFSLLGKGASDPFCTCEIPGKEDSFYQSKHIEKTLEPNWNEEFVIDDYVQGDTLSFQVLDYDRGSSADLLGRYLLKARDFDRQDGFGGEMRLKETGKGHKAYLKASIAVLPPKRPPMPPVFEKGGKIRILVLGAKNLRAADFSFMGKGSSDPFCSVQLVGKEDTLMQSKHIEKNLNPEWNEEFEFDEYVPGDEIEFKVSDYDKGSAADLLGRARLPAYEYDRSDGYDDELRLRECGQKGIRSYIRLKVTVVPPRPYMPPVFERGSRLKIKVLKANGLRAADWSLMGGGKSDPFCVVEIEGKPDSQVQTAHIDKTLDPVWNEEFEIDEYEAGDALTFSVMDYDRGSSADLLGKCSLPALEYDRSDGFQGTLKLKGTGAGNSGKPGIRSTVTVAVQVLPPKRPPKPPVSVAGGRLQVTLLGAKGLRAADFSLMGTGKSDPFCTVQVAGKEDSLCQTKHIEKTLDPDWNETFIMDEYVQGETLEFKVFDYDRGSSADLLGRAKLDFDFFDREDGFDDVIRLKECGKGMKATLRVRIAVLPPKRNPAPTVSLPGSRLKISLLSATGLRAADWSLMGGGKSDPFCTAQLVDREETLVKTKHISKTLEPVWNEDFMIEDYDSGDALELAVWDHDMVGSPDLLGRFTLAPGEFDRADGFDDEVKLKEAGKGAKAYLRLKIEMLEPLPSGPTISEPGSRVCVKVLGAKGLRAADWSIMGGGKSDPYCRCIVAGRPETMAETSHKNKTLEPVWNEVLMMDDYDTGEALEFSIFDYDKFSKADPLGKARLSSSRFDREGGFEGEVRLREAGKGKAPTLRLKVTVLPPLKPTKPSIAEPGSRLFVHIIGAKGLRAADWSVTGGKSDPYCEYKISGREGRPYQTFCIPSSLDPEWNECAEFDYVKGEALEFRVMDRDRTSKDDLLGQVRLKSREFDHEAGFNGEVALRQCGPGHHAKLRLFCQVNLPKDSNPVVISVGTASGLPAAKIGAGGLLVQFSVPNRPRSKGRSKAAYLPKPGFAGEGRPANAAKWEDEMKLLSFCPGDAVEVVLLLAHSASDEPQPIATATLSDSSKVLSETGFSDRVALAAISGGPSGALFFRAETLPTIAARKRREYEERKAAEAEARRQRELAAMSTADEEMHALMAEEERLRQEEEQRRLAAQREAERLAHEEQVRRDRNKIINVYLHLAVFGDDLPVITLKGKNTVQELEDAAIKQGKLPLRPRFVDPTGEIDFSDPNRSLADLRVPDGYELSAEVFAILTASKDKTARIWNAGTGENVLSLIGHEGPVNSVVALPDLKFALTASADETARVWAIDRWAGVARPVFTLRGHEGSVNVATFSEDGLFIATAGEDTTVKLWCMRNGMCLRTLDAHVGPVVFVGFEEMGTRVRSIAKDVPKPTRKLYEFDTGIVVKSEKVAVVPSAKPTGATPSPCGRREIAPLEGAWEPQLVDAETGARLMFLEAHKAEVLSVSYIALRPPVQFVGERTLSPMREHLPQVDAEATRRNDPEATRLSEAVHEPTSRYIRPQRRRGAGGGGGGKVTEVTFP